MKELVKEVTEGREAVGKKGKELLDLGFKAVGSITAISQYYYKLEESTIINFLRKKHLEYWGRPANATGWRLSVCTTRYLQDYLHTSWEETDIEGYQAIPPQHVLDALKKAKERGFFDYYSIATLEHDKVAPDPLLLGRVMQHSQARCNSDPRYIIAQWDNDILIDDLI